MISDTAPISCVDLRVQEEPDRSAEDAAHTKRLLIQSLLVSVLQSLNKDKLMAELFLSKERRQGVSRYFFHCKRIIFRNKAISKLMKSSWSQTQYRADRVTTTQLLDTCCECGFTHHGASEEVKKQARHQLLQHTHNMRICFFKHGKPRGETIVCSEDSHLYHEASEHHQSAMKKKQYDNILERYL